MTTRARLTLLAIAATAAMLLVVAVIGGHHHSRHASAPPAAADETAEETTPAHRAAAVAASSPPSIAVARVQRPSRAGTPRRTSDDDVEQLATRFTRAWTALEVGSRDPAAAATLRSTIDDVFATELAAEHLPVQAQRAHLRGVQLLRMPGHTPRWMAIVRLLRHGSTQYLQLDIQRHHGHLLVHGFSD